MKQCKQFEIISGPNRCTITAERNTAKAYACGMAAAFSMAGQPSNVQVYDFEKGNKLFEAISF